MLCYDDVQKICTDFVNDPDITIAMECDWTDWLVQEVPLEYSAEQIMHALNVTTKDEIVTVPVIHQRYGNQVVYVVICDKCIIISTRESLLYE